MKAPDLLLAELSTRNLASSARSIAERHHCTLEEVCEPARRAEIVHARRAIWLHQLGELKSLAAIARLWGCDRTSIRLALCEDGWPIVRVLLDHRDTPGHAFRFEWIAGAPDPFRISDLEFDRVVSFATYNAAREIWRECCELAGEPTFRSASLAAPAAPAGAS